jgi:modification methylase
MQDLGFWILNEVVWIKSNPMPNFRGVRFTNAHETLIWARASKRSGTRFNHHDMKALNGDLQMRSDWILPVVSGRERLQWNGAKAHSAQKPESLLYRVILSSSQVNDVVLDPFFGTGTSGVVAKRLGRHYIGIELNPKYARLAASRLQKTLAHQLDVVEGLRQKEQRVPFGTLVERGLLRPGDRLYWEDGTRTATILANGHIRFGRVVGSIHKVASAISGAPSNGWTAWSFRNTNGRLQKIDALRKRVLRKT